MTWLDEVGCSRQTSKVLRSHGSFFKILDSDGAIAFLHVMPRSLAFRRFSNFGSIAVTLFLWEVTGSYIQHAANQERPVKPGCASPRRGNVMCIRSKCWTWAVLTIRRLIAFPCARLPGHLAGFVSISAGTRRILLQSIGTTRSILNFKGLVYSYLW